MSSCRLPGTEGRHIVVGFFVSEFSFGDGPNIANKQNAKDASTVSTFVRLSF